MFADRSRARPAPFAVVTVIPEEWAYGKAIGWIQGLAPDSELPTGYHSRKLVQPANQNVVAFDNSIVIELA